MIRTYRFGDVPESEIFARSVPSVNVEDIVAGIIDNVRNNGDSAVLDYTEKFDGVRPDPMLVSGQEIAEAVSGVGDEFLLVLRRAAENITAFHSHQVRNSFIMNDREGVVIGQKVIPVASAGIYVPGGTAAYPSTVLMDSIPAKIAGVRNITMVTPPGKNGKIPDAILAAAYVAGVDRIYKVGGAQAIAALAYGTETIARVDKIVGPGNAFVAEAKKQVYGQVSIDMIAGPSEILVIADGKSDPAFVAADLLSQAEHDRMASAVLITDSASLAAAVAAEIEKQLSELEREEIARASIDNNGKIIIVDDLFKAVEVSDRIAPEHLELCVDDPFSLLGKVHNAGSVFMGRYCPEALGDYMGGPNHTLPTSGTARFSSPLSVDDFVKKTQYTYYDRNAFGRLAGDISVFARREGLTGHARSAEIRMEERNNQ